MTIKNLTLSVLSALLLLTGAACKNDPEEPETDRSTGDEIGDAIEEGAEDTEEAADEATEDLDDGM